MSVRRLLEEQEARLAEQAATAEELRVARLVHAVVAEHMQPVASRLTDLEDWRRRVDTDLMQLIGDVRANTEITVQVHELISAGRVVRKTADGLGWLGTTIAKIGVGVAAVYGALQALFHFKGPSP